MFSTPRPVPELPIPNRSKRYRPANPDIDVELDNYFQSKRFMTETIAKEMEDVAIADLPITTSPSRTSTLSRLAERGPSRSGVTSVLDFDAPRLSVSGSNGRRRTMIVTNATDAIPLRSSSSDIELEEDEEDADLVDNGLDGSTIEWRTPKPSIPRGIQTVQEDALQRLIEKKKEAESKSLTLYRSPSDIIKDAAQQALLAKVRNRPLNGSSASMSASGFAPFSANSRAFVTPIQPRPSYPMNPNSRFSMTPNTMYDPSTSYMSTSPPMGGYGFESGSPERMAMTPPRYFDRGSFSAYANSRGRLSPGISIEELPSDEEVPGSSPSAMQNTMSTSPPPFRRFTSSPPPPSFSMFDQFSSAPEESPQMDVVGMELSSTPPMPSHWPAEPTSNLMQYQ